MLKTIIHDDYVWFRCAFKQLPNSFNTILTNSYSYRWKPKLGLQRLIGDAEASNVAPEAPEKQILAGTKWGNIE